MNKTTYLYRFFDSNQRLLYVGISYHIESRLDSHRHQKPWDKVARITVESHPTREGALTAERRAIRDEKPAWNVVHTAPPPVTKGAFVTIAKARWPSAEWIVGRGQYATLAYCRDVLTVMLHDSHDRASAVMRNLASWGCGGFCVNDHDLVDLTSDDRGRGPDRNRYPRCFHCRTRLVEWYISWDDKKYCNACFEALDLPPPIPRPRNLADLVAGLETT